VRVLEAEGLVALADGDDQRNRVVLLTEAGTQLLRAAYPAWEQAQIKLVERLGEGPRDELVRLLDQLA
jgi:DNA-binding MarR family transcriptional regulator